MLLLVSVSPFLKSTICSSDQGPELQGTKTSLLHILSMKTRVLEATVLEASIFPPLPPPGSSGSAGSEGAGDTLRQLGCWVN